MCGPRRSRLTSGAGPSSVRQGAVVLGMAELSFDAGRRRLRRTPRSDAEGVWGQTWRVVGVHVSVRRAVAPGRDRDDERRVGALFQYFGRFRRSVGRFAPRRRRRRVEGGRVALDADLNRQARLVPPSPCFRLSILTARATSMDMYDEPNPDRVARAVPAVGPLSEAGGAAATACGRNWARIFSIAGSGALSWRRSKRAGAAFRADPLFEELDRYPLLRAHRVGAQRRSRPDGANPHSRPLLCALEPVAKIRRPNAHRRKAAPKPPEPGGDGALPPIAARTAERPPRRRPATLWPARLSIGG